MRYSAESAFDPVANLRLLRISGDNIPDRVLVGIGQADPTSHLISTAKNLVDIRAWNYEGSVVEIETQAAMLTEIFSAGLGEGYAWVTNPAIHGVTLVFRRQLVDAGLGKPMAFTTLEAALEYLGVTMDDFLRVESRLEAIQLPD
ncbi:MAG: hypothetical protein ACLGHX_06990 [Acidimicrobiia bacterium]